jgi:D-glycero-alpha-D-manno-heptose-7-phosphate kinase
MLWITRTPLRVSLFGGGTDYPEYFHRHPGAVIGLAINQYIHIGALKLNSLLDYNYRLSYSKLELCSNLDDIEHPVVREVLRWLEVKEHLDISVMSDLPASGSGLGSSSAFSVGFLRLAYAIQNRPVTKIDLARAAINVERNLLAENVGVQDQLHTAFGGVNKFEFEGERIRVTPLQLSGRTFATLRTSMALVHTGIARRATDAAAAQVQEIRHKRVDTNLGELCQMANECVEILESQRDNFMSELGRLLNHSWVLKRGLASSVSNESIDRIFERIISSGAYGAKLCGAGGGGFFLALIPPDRLESLKTAVAPLSVISVDIDVDGSTLIYPAQHSFAYR